MNIRAHHLICMKSFRSKGYNKEFVDNFYDVINKINKENPKIKITNKPDDICKVCPYNKNGCIKENKNSEIKVKNKDNKIIHLLKIKGNSEINYNEIFNLMNQKITKEIIKNICKDCEWLNYCIN